MINRVVLVGRLTKDVEVRKSASQLSVANFTVACDRRSKGTGDNQQSADFINCVVWRQPADFLGQYGKKGSLIGVDGRIQTRSYEKDGHMVYVTEVIADNVRILESKATTEARMQGTGANDYYPDNSYSYEEDSYASMPSAPSASDEDFNISSEDLPF